MMSLIALLVVLVGFTILAIKNWGKTIGAGPTILIVGAIVVSVFGAVKWADYQQQLREYDVCEARVERSQETYVFNNALVTIIERELPDEPFGTELRDVMLLPLDESICQTEPSFLNSLV